jgi:hypothetical protein
VRVVAGLVESKTQRSKKIKSVPPRPAGKR